MAEDAEKQDELKPKVRKFEIKKAGVHPLVL
jgi:hypothetical protein